MSPTYRILPFLKTNFEVKTADEATASSCLRLAAALVKRDIYKKIDNSKVVSGKKSP